MRRLEAILGSSLLLATLAGSPLAGCMAVEPTTTQHGTDPSVMPPDFSPAPDMAPAGPVQPPVVSGLPTTSMYTAYPVKGLAGPNDTVIIEGTATGSIAVQVDPSGSFCGLVQLTPNATTTMTLHAVDPDGNASSSITLTVTQSGSPPSQPAPQPSTNAALQGTGNATFSFSTGDESLMHDGDQTTFAQGGQSDFSTSDAIWLTIPQATIVAQIHIRAPASCPLTAPFQLFLSDETPANDPGPGVAGWTTVSPAPVADSDDTDWVVNFTTPPTIQSLGIYFQRSLIISGNQVSCGDTFFGAQYAISEIELWTVPGIAPPPIGAPSCGD